MLAIIFCICAEAPLIVAVDKIAIEQALNNLVNEKAGISPEMAIRLDKAFGGTAEAWLALQTAYDLAQARRKMLANDVKRYSARNRNERLRSA